MSFKIIGSAFELPLIGNDKLVFLALCENADDTTRTCWPSYPTIQKKASLVNSSLKTVLEVLEAVGLISIKIRSTKGGGRTSTLYKISEFDVDNFDVKNYKKIAKEIRAIRNFRENKETQTPRIGTVNKYPNLRNSIQMEDNPQPPKIDVVLDTQPPEIGEEPLASSFQPLALREEEEDVCKVEIVINSPSLPPLVIPSELKHLDRRVVEDALNRMVFKNAKFSRTRYRIKAYNGLAAGEPGWISEIFEFVRQVQTTSEAPWKLKERMSREDGERKHQALLNCGFTNPGEAYAAAKASREGVQDDF